MKHARSDYDRIQDPAGKIHEDEPVFLVRAQDPAAPAAVEAWAAENDRMGGDRVLSDLARQQAARMRLWPVKKVADGPHDAPVVEEKKVEEPPAEPKPGISTAMFGKQ